DGLESQMLEGTDDGGEPFWSPDSRFVGFFTQDKLKKVAIAGGPPEVICASTDARGGTWSPNGVIVFAPTATGPLVRVSPDGGDPVEVARPDSARGETALRWPQFLPDGRHFLFVTLPQHQGVFDTYVGSLDSMK